MRIKCVFCGDWINNPTMSRIKCGKEECKKESRRLGNKEYNKNPENRKKRAERMKIYNRKPEVKKKRNAKARIYMKALCELKKNHKEEFDDIHKKLKKRIK